MSAPPNNLRREASLIQDPQGPMECLALDVRLEFDPASLDVEAVHVGGFVLNTDGVFWAVSKDGRDVPDLDWVKSLKRGLKELAKALAAELAASRGGGA